MKNKKKKCNFQLIRSNRTYTISELAELLNRTEWTIRYWIRIGFITTCGTNPVKIKGAVPKEALRNRKQKNKLHSINDFYCVACKKKANVDFDNIEIVYTEKKSSPTKTQIILKVKCPNCGHKINRFGSVKTTEAKEEGVSTHPFIHQHTDEGNAKGNSLLKYAPKTRNWRSI
jgi:DNA-directed RNA polymerase subunit RPC12/RpoP